LVHGQVKTVVLVLLAATLLGELGDLSTRTRHRRVLVHAPRTRTKKDVDVASSCERGGIGFVELSCA